MKQSQNTKQLRHRIQWGKKCNQKKKQPAVVDKSKKNQKIFALVCRKFPAKHRFFLFLVFFGVFKFSNSVYTWLVSSHHHIITSSSDIMYISPLENWSSRMFFHFQMPKCSKWIEKMIFLLQQNLTNLTWAIFFSLISQDQLYLWRGLLYSNSHTDQTNTVQTRQVTYRIN